jgi:uncharacterized protein YdeI (YjbR/CyaY-like superfamily)
MAKAKPIESPEVDADLAKSEKWPECARLRGVMLDCNLSESLKWQKPCYAQAGNDISVPKPDKLALVQELAAPLRTNSSLRHAFEALTPGRQRAYNLYVSGAKQASTRASRVQACVPQILAGKGLRD